MVKNILLLGKLPFSQGGAAPRGNFSKLSQFFITIRIFYALMYDIYKVERRVVNPTEIMTLDLR